MKKVLFAMMMVVMAIGVRAQVMDSESDTLFTRELPSRYFYESWIDTNTFMHGHFGSEYYGAMAKRFVTEDTLVVYGVAISMETLEGDFVYDTSYDRCYEYVGLYKNTARGDSLVRVGERKKVHIQHTPVAYYINYGLNVMEWTSPDNSNYNAMPVYELYFDRPMVMTDSFYVGWTNYTQVRGGYTDSVTMHQYASEYYRVLICMLLGYGGHHDSGKAHVDQLVSYGVKWWNPTDSIWRWSNEPNMAVDDEYYFAFPIVAPRSSDSVWRREDSTWYVWDEEDSVWVVADSVNGGSGGEDTTLSVGSVEVADRYTQLVPNPATTEVRVVSSMGVRDVEVYDAGGRRVWKGVGEGMVTKIETGGWPRGVYMVKVSTRAGVTTKRLLLK